jgi:hypothetical protein
MIVYDHRCAEGHRFEGWYASPQAHERQAAAGHVACPTCGNTDVRKLPAAPYVHTAAANAPVASNAPSAPSAPAGPVALLDREKALGLLRTFILANTEDVGRRFPEVARRIHEGEEAARGIRGLATPEEAATLAEEGIEAFVVDEDLGLTGPVH